MYNLKYKLVFEICQLGRRNKIPKVDANSDSRQHTTSKNSVVQQLLKTSLNLPR